MTNNNYNQHLLHIYAHLHAVRSLPVEQRVKPTEQLITYFKNNLSDELEAEIKEVKEAQQDLYFALSEAKHLESSYDLLYSAFAKARDQLRHDPDHFDGFGDLLEQIPCKSSTEALIHLLAEDEASIEQIVRLYLAEHYAILHPEQPNQFADILKRIPF